jgi:hypothetical protein
MLARALACPRRAPGLAGPSLSPEAAAQTHGEEPKLPSRRRRSLDEIDESEGHGAPGPSPRGSDARPVNRECPSVRPWHHSAANCNSRQDEREAHLAGGLKFRACVELHSLADL